MTKKNELGWAATFISGGPPNPSYRTGEYIMGRIQSDRCVANTQITSADADQKNACVFNGLLVSVLNPASTATAYFTVYEDYSLIGGAPLNGVLAASGNTFSATSAGALKNQGIKAGMKIEFQGTSADDGIKTVVSLDAAGTVLTLDSVTGNETVDAMIIPLRIVASFNYVYVVDHSKAQSTEAWNYTNGILCRNGLKIVSTSWTNLEAYVLHS